ncbi:NAD(P)-dependent alcohol dehydrogenase [uncultured Microbacterium sp.]|uniref:Zn-dependent oxidoreductase, NADPH:quinone reductase n=1 Tax=uncultured Microbacterium sp. TaxID=191216 RepID=A0A1Y5P392_9MICO|nr:NAD(P)-dependent alcohol dehydrogenase [uncultured Microbacterium sp.]SBS73176.1 Zn-dependent oxidoreductase, NADPH:quinone reductase [uncultured Microbacterium sp.]
MKAAVYRRFGGPDVVHIEHIADLEPKPDELLIRVHASTVSAADYRSRSRDIPAGLALPSSLVLGFFRPRRPVLGMEAAGIVEKTGDDVHGFAPGDEVAAMLGSRFGGHAEYALVKATDAVVHKPRGLGFDEAASLIFGGITAQAYLNQTTVQAGTSILVNGASGAVGSAFVQIASAVGAHVTAVCSEPNHALVTDLGAQRTIDYRSHDFTADGTNYDVIVDCVGNAPVSRVARSVRPGGAVLLVAADLRSLLNAKRDARRHGITVVTGPGSYRAADLQHVMYLAEVGDIRPVIDRSYPLDDIAQAHRFVDTGRKRGSVVINIAEATETASATAATDRLAAPTYPATSSERHTS